MWVHDFKLTLAKPRQRRPLQLRLRRVLQYSGVYPEKNIRSIMPVVRERTYRITVVVVDVVDIVNFHRRVLVGCKRLNNAWLAASASVVTE